MNKGEVQIQGISKRFRLGEIGFGSLKDDFSLWWKRTFGGGIKLPEKRIQEKNLWALRDINLKIPAGHKLGLIGANGSGKSTLLKILSRIIAPTLGIIRYTGRIGSLLEVGTGFHQELTGRENIFLSGAILGMKKPEILQSFEEIVEFSGVSEFLDTPVKRYSSGMYVRLAFSVAAHLRSDILLVDEVLAVGDREFRQKALKKMHDLGTRDGKTLVFVSHRMGAIREICDSVLLLNDGQGRHFEQPEEGIRAYSLTHQNDTDVSLLSGELAPKVVLSRIYWNGDTRVYLPETKVELSFEFNHHCEEPVAYGIRVFRLGTLVFSKYSPEPLGPTNTNKATFRLEVPPFTLRPGDYQLEVYGFGLRSKKTFHSSARAGFRVEQKWSKEFIEWDHGLININ